MRLLTVLATALLPGVPALAGTAISGGVTVVDGDTLAIEGVEQ